MPAIPAGVRGGVITGWGDALPPKVLTNHDLEQMFETNHDWIVELGEQLPVYRPPLDIQRLLSFAGVFGCLQSRVAARCTLSM